MRKIFAGLLSILLITGICRAAERVTMADLLFDLAEAYEAPSEDDMGKIEADVAALDDPVAASIAEHWRQVYLDPGYKLFLYGEDDPAGLMIPDPASHAFVILGYELKDGEMTEELKGRCDAGAAAARAFPDSILVCSGGATGRNNPEKHTEAGLMKEYLVSQWGIDPARIHIDERAMNTAENAIHTFEILRGQGIGTMTIVTSSYHQRRAQVLYNALAARYGQEFDYRPAIIGNFCFATEPSGGMPVADDRLAVMQLAGILELPREQMSLLSEMGSGEASGDPSGAASADGAE